MIDHLTADRAEQRQSELLGDRYSVGALIGVGTWTVVYEAADQQLAGRRVAVKVCRRQHAGDQDVSEQISRSLYIQARLVGSPIVDVFDKGTTSDGLVFGVLTLVPGFTLAEVFQLRRWRPLGPRAALWIFADVCSVLAASHRRGVVHGAVSPSKVLLTHGLLPYSERAHLVGFGQSIIVDETKYLGSDDHRLGPCPSARPRCPLPSHYSLAYDSSSKALGPKADLTAAGGLLHEMVTGVLAQTPDQAFPVTEQSRRLPKSLVELVRWVLSVRGSDQSASADDCFDEAMFCLRTLYPPPYSMVERPGRAAMGIYSDSMRPATLGWRDDAGEA